METSISDKKWKVINNVIEEINLIQKNENSQNEKSQRINEISKKLLRVKGLKEKVDKDEQDLKLEYLILMRERNLYFEKLKSIQSLGDEYDWKDSDLLENIRKILFTYGKNENSEI